LKSKTRSRKQESNAALSRTGLYTTPARTERGASVAKSLFLQNRVRLIIQRENHPSKQRPEYGHCLLISNFFHMKKACLNQDVCLIFCEINEGNRLPVSLPLAKLLTPL